MLVPSCHSPCHWSHLSLHNYPTTFLPSQIPKLRSEIQWQVEKCDLCQHLKCGSRQYGNLALCNAPIAPWQTVAVDCIGPWVIKLRGGKEIKVITLTTIDIVTNLNTSLQKHLSNVHMVSKTVGCRDTTPCYPQQWT